MPGPQALTPTRAARRITERLGLPWGRVRMLAFMDGAARTIALGRALGEGAQDWLTPEYLDFALRLAARRLGRSTLTPGAYAAVREELLSSRRDDLRLPNEHQVVALVGSWDRALAHAGLAARMGRGGQRPRSAPVPIVDVLERCFEHHGTEPTSRELETFARANGIPFPRRERGRPWTDYVREWKDARRAQGLHVPDGPPPKRHRPDDSQDVGAARPGERRKKDSWQDLDECSAWVARYLDQLARGKRPSQRDYNAWARRQPGAPWSAAFKQHGGWEAVRAAAQRRRRTT